MCTSECKRGRKVCLRDTLSHSSPNQAREKTTKHNCSHSPSRSVARVTRFVILASIKYSKGLSGHGAQSRDWRPKSRCAGGGGRGGDSLRRAPALSHCAGRHRPSRWAEACPSDPPRRHGSPGTGVRGCRWCRAAGIGLRLWP